MSSDLQQIIDQQNMDFVPMIGGAVENPDLQGGKKSKKRSSKPRESTVLSMCRGNPKINCVPPVCSWRKGSKKTSKRRSIKAQCVGASGTRAGTAYAGPFLPGMAAGKRGIKIKTPIKTLRSRAHKLVVKASGRKAQIMHRIRSAKKSKSAISRRRATPIAQRRLAARKSAKRSRRM